MQNCILQIHSGRISARKIYTKPSLTTKTVKEDSVKPVNNCRKHQVSGIKYREPGIKDEVPGIKYWYIDTLLLANRFLCLTCCYFVPKPASHFLLLSTWFFLVTDLTKTFNN